MSNSKPVSIGRTVYYVVPKPEDEQAPKPIEAHNGAEVLPAVVVRVSSNEVVNLKISCDGPETIWRPSVIYDENRAPGTWHWPEMK